MNNELLNLFKPFGFNKPIQDLTNNLQNANEETAVFYTLNSADEAESIFKDRLSKSKALIVFVTRAIAHEVKDRKVVVLSEDDFLEMQKKILDILYPMPDVKLVGVTGTNGKTSTVTLARQIADLCGVDAASIGTLGVYLGNKSIKDFGMTTPSFIDFRKIIFELKDKIKVLFFELSSHALIQDRIYKVKIDAGGWSSFSQDHLDYHHSMEEYFKAKCKIHSYLKEQAKIFVPTEETELCEKIKMHINQMAMSKSLAELGFQNIPKKMNTLFGRRNLELALNLCLAVGIKVEKIDLNKLEGPLGRFSVLYNKNAAVIIDYAHTPDALEKVIIAAKKTFPGKKIITVFGCGGNRDNKKRPIMGEIAANFSDEVIVTSDNPRNEDPFEIINQIKIGIINQNNFTVEPDRTKAIVCALKKQNENIVVIIAGKGHEDYQEIKGVKHSYSDFTVVEDFVRSEK